MIIFDFLIYNLTNWYTIHRDRLKWSTPLEKAIYVVGIISMLWFFDFWIIINTFLLKNDTLKGSSIPFVISFVILGLVIMQIFQYIYSKKGRLERLNQAPNKPFNVGDNVGQVFSIGFFFLPLIILGIFMLLF
jgi:hypothetical protein